MRRTEGKTWLDPEEATYNTRAGGHSGSGRQAFVRFPDGTYRKAILGVADTFSTIPAHATVRGHYVSGFVTFQSIDGLQTTTEGEYVFIPLSKYDALFSEAAE